jgi:hypothetical protein
MPVSARPDFGRWLYCALLPSLSFGACIRSRIGKGEQRESAAIRSEGKSRLAAARRDNSCNKRALSDARRSMRVSLGERNALIPMGAPMAKQRQARSMQLLLRRPQPVADPGFRQYVLRPFGISFDLLPQLPHIDPQVLRVGETVP